MKLKTIQEHNEEVLNQIRSKYLTGIACPKCGEEMQYQNPDILLLSSPPQANIICFECGYADIVYAKT